MKNVDFVYEILKHSKWSWWTSAYGMFFEALIHNGLSVWEIVLMIDQLLVNDSGVGRMNMRYYRVEQIRLHKLLSW